MALEAWKTGVSVETKRPFTLVRGVAVAVVQAIVAHCPDIGKREAWARAKGQAWARVTIAEGRRLKALDFSDWVASGEPVARVVKVDVAPVEGPRVKAARRERLEAEREARSKASPITPEALENLSRAGLR
jgi:hypothetical protein